MVRRLGFTLVSGLVLAGCMSSDTPRRSTAWSDDPMSAAVRDLCSRKIALIGEGANHGDGRTLAFKSELVRRLVEQCGFTAVVFEASSYDFLEIDRRLAKGRPVTREMVSSAVGGLWNRNDEMQPLITFLHQAVVAGRVRLGGMDDQLGSAGAFYSISDMPGELAALLPSDRAGECAESLRQLIYGQLASPSAETVTLVECLADMRRVVDAAPDGVDREVRERHLINVESYLARQGADRALRLEGRSRSMWSNFSWLVANTIGRDAKVIVWGASVHLSRDASVYPPFAGIRNFGSRVDDAYGDAAFFLGFSATSGSYLEGAQVRDRRQALPDSLEAAAVAAMTTDAVYLDRARLKNIGEAPGAVFSPSAAPVAAAWSEVFDGVVVFREERPPTRSALTSNPQHRLN